MLVFTLQRSLCGFDGEHFTLAPALFFGMAPAAIWLTSNCPLLSEQFRSAYINVPQDGENNRHVWAGIEGVVRKLAQKEGDLYVITGPAFIGGNLQKVGNVLVPTHLYKLVYSPRQHAGAAFFIENRAGAEYQTLSIAQLESKVGIDLLPSLSAAQKDTLLRLPKARQRKDGSKR